MRAKLCGVGGLDRPPHRDPNRHSPWIGRVQKPLDTIDTVWKSLHRLLSPHYAFGSIARKKAAINTQLFLGIVASMESLSVPELVERLGSDEESVRKMAVFKLQSAIGDPSFADVFILEGGLPKLRFLALHSTGNTLAYCLTSLSRLLELDKGWDHVTDDLIKRVSPRRVAVLPNF